LRRQFKLKATIYDKKGRILSTGENSYQKTHPVQKQLAEEAGRPDAIFLHAEIQALVRLKDKASQAHKIFIERYTATGIPVPAKPCEICTLGLEKAGIEIVEYT
jgi:tRNA(Arg) A34 adenosine deaminase TadA